MFIGMLFATGSLFSQTLSKEQEIKLKDLHKQVQTQVDQIVDNDSWSLDDKKNRINVEKERRDARLDSIITPEQKLALQKEDPIEWEEVVKKIEKQASAKSKKEMNQKLDEIEETEKKLDSKEKELEQQEKKIENEKKDIEKQRKSLKEQRKQLKKK